MKSAVCTTTDTAAIGGSAAAAMPTPKKQQASTDKARKIKLSECKAAAYTLAEAFAEDEVARYFVDTQDLTHWTEAQKWDLHLSILEYLTYLHCLCGAVTTVGDDYGCVALWLPPGTDADSLLAQVRAGVLRLYYNLSREGRLRFFREFCPLLHDTKLDVLGKADDANSYYLVYIGTRARSRGQGLARRCMAWGMDRADREGLRCYLESSNTVNLKIYSRMGFQLKKQISLLRGVKEGKAEEVAEACVEDDRNVAKNGEVILDIMVREPVSNKA